MHFSYKNRPHSKPTFKYDALRTAGQNIAPRQPAHTQAQGKDSRQQPRQSR